MKSFGSDEHHRVRANTIRTSVLTLVALRDGLDVARDRPAERPMTSALARLYRETQPRCRDALQTPFAMRAAVEKKLTRRPAGLRDFRLAEKTPGRTLPQHQRTNTMRLRANEVCPIHRSTSCCGRETTANPRRIRLGVQRVEDPHHPRGYRELRSPAEMRTLLNRKVRQQAGICAICHEEFSDYNDVVPDHKNPKGMGGAWRDDHPDNIQATHWWCNEEKGSTRIYE